MRLPTHQVLPFKCLKGNLNCQLIHSNSKSIDREVILGHLACLCQGAMLLYWVFSDDFADSFSIRQAGRQFLNWKNSASSVGKLLCWFPAPRCSMQCHSFYNKKRKGFKESEARPTLWHLVHVVLPVPLEVAHYTGG